MQTVVDLSRLRHNIRLIRAKTGNGFCAVVKADAYGHGLAVASYIEPLVDCFMTANYDEAATVAASGVRKPILVLGGDVGFVVHNRYKQIIPTVCSVRQLEFVANCGVKNFSVEVDTGMHRLGADERELEAMIEFMTMRNLSAWSTYSHIYNGVTSAPEQSELFDKMTNVAVLNRRRHLYSSVALDMPQGVPLFDMTRCGIAMYGFASGLETALRARAKIVSVAAVERGKHVGYDDFVLDKDSVIATVACGYADGLRRCDKPLYLTVRGVKCRVVGVPCMDMCMIDVSDARCRVGEFAYLIQDKEDAEYLAKCYGTIVYEILTGLNGRAERIYM